MLPVILLVKRSGEMIATTLPLLPRWFIYTQPIAPNPPDLLTTVTGCSTRCSDCQIFCKSRAVRSNPLPGSVPTMISIGRSGFQAFCANAGGEATTSANTADKANIMILFVGRELIVTMEPNLLVVRIADLRSASHRRTIFRGTILRPHRFILVERRET